MNYLTTPPTPRTYRKIGTAQQGGYSFTEYANEGRERVMLPNLSFGHFAYAYLYQTCHGLFLPTGPHDPAVAFV
jgi:hypothetical protein